MAQGSREDAIRALINFWLRDPSISCGSCGSAQSVLNLKVKEDGNVVYECCDNVFLGDNKSHFEHFRKELRETRETRSNKYASQKDKSMRLAIQMPPALLLFLEHSFRRLYKEELFTKKYNVIWFAKKFRKEFSVPEEI